MKISRDEGAVITCGTCGQKVVCDTVADTRSGVLSGRTDVVIVGWQDTDSPF